MGDSTNQQARYPLRAVIRRTGLSADVIRAWERRYGAVSPTRSDGGQRLYTDDDVVRLALLRKATTEGHSISEIARLDRPALEALAARGRTDRRTSADQAVPTILAEAIAAVETLDQAALESALKRAVLSLGATRFVDTVAAVVLQEVGDRWHAGTLAPFHEHLTSDTMRRVLAWVGDAYQPDRDAPAIVVATPAGEFHELGAMLVAAAASEEAWRVIYLGPNLPAHDLVAAAITARADLVALSLVYAHGDVPVSEFRQTARALPHGSALVVGGAAAMRLGSERLGPPIHLLEDVASFRRFLRARRDVKVAIAPSRAE